MSKLSILRNALEHLETSEYLLLNGRWAFSKDSDEWNRINSECEHISNSIYVLNEIVLAHIESEIYQASMRAALEEKKESE